MATEAEAPVVEIDLPEGFDADAASTLKALAGELGLDKARGGKLVAAYQKAQAEAEKRAEAAFVAQAKQYVAQAEQHPVVKELGGVDKARALAGKALSVVGSKELGALLQASGLAYHPEVLALFARVGARLGDDSVRGAGNGTAAPKPTAEQQLRALYDHPTSRVLFKE